MIQWSGGIHVEVPEKNPHSCSYSYCYDCNNDITMIKDQKQTWLEAETCNISSRSRAGALTCLTEGVTGLDGHGMNN